MTTTPDDPDAGWGDCPVDSTYYPCCRSIGGHGRYCPDGPAAIFAAAERQRNT